MVLVSVVWSSVRKPAAPANISSTVRAVLVLSFVGGVSNRWRDILRGCVCGGGPVDAPSRIKSSGLCTEPPGDPILHALCRDVGVELFCGNADGSRPGR
jgi:hypothetical protein